MTENEPSIYVTGRTFPVCWESRGFDSREMREMIRCNAMQVAWNESIVSGKRINKNNLNKQKTCEKKYVFTIFGNINEYKATYNT